MGRWAILAAAAIFLVGYFLRGNQVVSVEAFRLCSWISFGLAALGVLWGVVRLFAGGASRIFLGLLIVAGLLGGGAALLLATFSGS